MGQTRFIEWTASGSSLPPTWSNALTRFLSASLEWPVSALSAGHPRSVCPSRERRRHSACLFGIALLSGCLSAEQSAPLTGVSASDAREISRVVIARSHGQIAYYEREDDGKIAAWMLPGHDPQFGDISRGHRPFHAYVVRRVGGRWQIVDEHVMVGGDG
jgi:hypothetical protein